MTTNAQFWVECEVTTPSGNKRIETVSVASPDLASVTQAHKRARKTAQERLLNRERKQFGVSGHLVKVVAVHSRCVG